jgi:pimeloyl-ACP methyl ester carboxylesterase
LPRDASYSVETEVDDVLRVLEHTGSRVVFGHSYGGLIGLHVGMRQALDALIVYEPAVSLDGSFDLGWLDAFRRQVDDHRFVSAMTTFLKGAQVLPFRATPLLWAISVLLLFGREERDLMPLTPAELDEIARLDSDGSRYAGITSPTLFLGGVKSPAYVTGVLPRLAALLPKAEYTIVPDLDHNAPDESAPDEIARQLRQYLVRLERRSSAGPRAILPAARRELPGSPNAEDPDEHRRIDEGVRRDRVVRPYVGPRIRRTDRDERLEHPGTGVEQQQVQHRERRIGR